jgi:drug/metabolite transporter (DMT)-like permease
MNARALVLYAAVVLIWGSTWIAIPLQLGVVAEEVSVAWRFALGSLSLFIYAAATGRQIRIPLANYGMVILMGALMFSANYLFTYYSINYVTSGLVAVMFSLIVVFNAFFERIFFGRPLERRLIIASVLGVAGVAFMFWPEVRTFNLQDESLYGVTLALIAVVLASIGNMAAIVNTNRHLPVVSMNAHGMAWGAAVSLVVSALAGKEIGFLFQPGYIVSLLYLSVFGSAVAFGCYLALLRQIGAARAAYTAVLFPIVALILSTLFENYTWTPQAIVGVLFILAGNWLALTRIEGN